jgi:hypothetical protein
MRWNEPARGDGLRALAALLLLLTPARVAAQQGESAANATARAAAGYQHWFGGLNVGRGVRFNNPYRLRSVLGDDAESLSLTATYLQLHVARSFGAPDDFQHGLAAHFFVAIDGVRQELISPSYVLSRRLSPRWLGYARAGLPIVLEPDTNLGLEAALGASYFLSAALGLAAELDLSVFYGAATFDEPVSTIPILSLSFGVFVDWEVLP